MAQTVAPNFVSPMDSLVRGRRLNYQQAQSGCYNYDCSYTQCDPTIAYVSVAKCTQYTFKNYGTDPSTNGRRNTYFPNAFNCLNTNSSCTAAPMPSQSKASCVADPNEIAWNNGGGAWCSWVATSNWTTFDPTTGPNINCPMPMLGLSGNRSQVLATMNRMSPVVGGTHADVGLLWGARSLSPRNTWQSFFGTTAKPPKNWNANNVKKALVLITDGENTQANDFPGYWGCADTNAPGCTGSPTQSELNTKMLDWCTKLRVDYKVDVYTVAVNINNTTAVTLLGQCAGDPEKAFSGDASQLNSSLSNVAAQLFDLHLRE